MRMDTQTGKLECFDEKSRKQDLHKMMKALAQERLRAELNSLETQAQLSTKRPTVILGYDCLLYQLKHIKNWLWTRQCDIIVPSGGMFM